MLKNRLISALLAASLIAGVTSCSTDPKKDSGGDRPRNTVMEENKPGAEEDDAGSIGAGAATSETEETTAPAEDTEDTNTTTNTQNLVTTAANEDYVLFAYEHGNMAWGYQSAKMLILNNGDVYVFENAAGTAADMNGRDLAVQYLKTYSKPSYQISVKKLKELYDICKQIDPDVETKDKNTGNDMGSYTFKFFDPETKQETLIIKTGDRTMTTDDKTLIKAQEKAQNILNRLGPESESLYLSLTSGFVNVPYGGKDLIGKHMSFDSYDKFLEFCNKNGIDVEKYLSDNLKKSYQQAKYIILQVYDTNLMVDGYLCTDNKVLRFLPSLADYEHNPDFDGKVTVAIMRCDQLEKLDLVNENGTPWK